jgi:hypothetical protein
VYVSVSVVLGEESGATAVAWPEAGEEHLEVAAAQEVAVKTQRWGHISLVGEPKVTRNGYNCLQCRPRRQGYHTRPLNHLRHKSETRATHMLNTQVANT